MNEAIDLRQFRYFLALSEELNFGRAATRLNISQPPLSRQIRQLENLLGVELFLRTTTGVILTNAGLAFVPEVKRALAQAAKAVAIAQATIEDECDQLRVGYTTVFDRSVIPDVSGPLNLRYPGVRIATTGKHSINLVRDISNGVMDVGFIGLHTGTKGLNVETLLEEPVVVALPASHPLARKRRLGFSDLADESIFCFERRLNPGFYDHCQAVFERYNFKPRTIPEPDDHHILLGLIAEGQGIAFVSASLKNVTRRGVVFRPLKNQASELSSGIAVVWNARKSSAVLDYFLELVRINAKPG